MQGLWSADRYKKIRKLIHTECGAQKNYLKCRPSLQVQCSEVYSCVIYATWPMKFTQVTSNGMQWSQMHLENHTRCTNLTDRVMGVTSIVLQLCAHNGINTSWLLCNHWSVQIYNPISNQTHFRNKFQGLVTSHAGSFPHTINADIPDANKRQIIQRLIYRPQVTLPSFIETSAAF